jgi:hypothetical protein
MISRESFEPPGANTCSDAKFSCNNSHMHSINSVQNNKESISHYLISESQSCMLIEQVIFKF